MITGSWRWMRLSGRNIPVSGLGVLPCDSQMFLWDIGTSIYLHEEDISICVCPCMYHKCLLLHVPAATGPDSEITSILRKERSVKDIGKSLSQSSLDQEFRPHPPLQRVNSYQLTEHSAICWPQATREGCVLKLFGLGTPIPLKYYSWLRRA